jgi:hypothetical protein
MWRCALSPAIAPKELERRRPVWDALSEFFLDTELDGDDYRRIRDILLGSGYPLEEIRRIFCDEVAPVVGWNLFSVAGEWACFDREWLEQRILNRRVDPPRKTLRGVYRRLAFLTIWQQVRSVYGAGADRPSRWEEPLASWLFFFLSPHGVFTTGAMLLLVFILINTMLR